MPLVQRAEAFIDVADVSRVAPGSRLGDLPEGGVHTLRARVNRFLTCGDPIFGFARIRCDDCGATRLLAFSCKGRYFCPSCHAKKVQIFGEFVSGEVAEAVAHRHWVFSVPKMLRPYFKFNRALLKDLYRIARGDAWWLGCARPSAGRDWHLKESHPYPHRIQ